MAEIRPLRALRYDAARVGDLLDVVSPPYDVIDDALQDALYERSPYNFVRVDFARTSPEDSAEDNRYTRAAATFKQWQESGVLQRDAEPSLYVYEQTFDADGETVVRKGFLGTVRLHEYSDRVILPHERTLSGPKADRMDLMVATQAQLSQLFLLYDDPERRVDAALEAARNASPDIEIRTDDGIEHRIWVVSDPAAIEFVRTALADERLLIADGHHRYETALAYRNRRRAETGSSGDQPWDFALAYLANSADPGLIVWPTHRAIHSVPNFDLGLWIDRVRPYFEQKFLDASDRRAVEAALAESGERTPSFVVLGQRGGEPAAMLLAYKPGTADEQLAQIPGPEEARSLDVNILHDFVLPTLTGISHEAQAAKTNIHYIKGLDAAFDAALDGEHQFVLLMNPLPVPKVRAVCESGGFMPQKSTYFYPKVLSGLVINDVR
jgi:uncharacterized protein (DUF1015 family)